MHDHKKKAKEEETPEQKVQREDAFAATGALYKSLLDHRKQKILMEVDGALAENTALLEKVPEMYTAYNVRRECLASSIFATATDAASLPTVLARITSDLQWNAAVLKKDPKIYAAFVHRYWLIEQLATMVDASSSSSKQTCGASSSPCELLLRRVLEKEQEQCEQLLRADERNFHAWNHRRWVLRMKARYDGDEAEQHTATPVSLFTPQEKQEMAYTLQQIKHNFSNYSAWHQRGLTLQAALRRHPVSSMNDAAADGVGLELHQYLVQDVALLTQAIYCDPKDQSAWFYAPYVLEVLELYAMHLPHDVATTRCAAEVVDGFVADVVEVLVEEGRFGERTGCALPLHFLWSFARGRGMNCPDHALTEREKRYVAWMQEKIPSCCEATNAASVVACLAKELQCVDPMRSGMYA